MQDVITFNPFTGPVIEKVIPIVQAQSEIWTACMFGGKDANRAYNESISLVLKGDLNREVLEDAIDRLILRHDALRATFSADGRFMTVFEELPADFAFQDLSDLNTGDQETAVKEYLSKDANNVFDLIKGPLLKIGLLKLSGQEHHLVITAHHIICDGWSMGIILEELGKIYSASLSGESPVFPQHDTFGSYADAELAFISSPEFIKTEKFWLNQYKESVPEVSLPTDFPRPQVRTFKSHRLDFEVESDLIADLKKVGIKSGASLVVTLMAAFEVFLNRITGQQDLVLGLPAAGQSLTGMTQLVGHCVNLLPLRTRIYPDTPFTEYLQNRKSAIFDAYEHQQFSFGQLLQKLPISRDPSRVPLVPVTFNIDMGMDSAVAFDGLDFELKSNPRAFETFELFLNATGREDAFILEWSYNSSLFKPTTIAQMMTSFKEVLQGIVADPGRAIGDLIKVDTSAYEVLNNTGADYPQLPLHELLAAQALKTPQNQALKFGNDALSYVKLEKSANQLANYLASQGVGTGDYVAVLLPRSIELVQTLIAIMKCGAAYLPLDPDYPARRLEFMLEDSGAANLITSRKVASSIESEARSLLIEDILPDLPKYPDTPPPVKVDNKELAYILYTSGSTGKPKGVPVTHGNLVNFLHSMQREPGIEETDRLLSITTISFDIAGLELFMPLLKGATVVLTSEENSRDSRLLMDVMKEEEITVMQATPTTWQMLLDAGWQKPLPIKALCGGEALPMSLAKSILERVEELWNMYGPTETTIWSAVKQVLKSDDLITVGRPIANTQLYIVNEYTQLVEPGKIGELCIAGDGVATGYWKRPVLTAEKFIANPFSPEVGNVLYRTGDLAKLLPSGEVQCLGRIDQQVKIRGHRIELGEIEQALDALEGVQSSVVIFNEGRLVANLIPTGLGSPDSDQVKGYKDILSQQLPAHMVPQQFIFVEAFPTTLNGKIDRKALQSLYGKKLEKAAFENPETISEKIIAAIWQEHLKIDPIDVNGDFFELGGHSLIAVRVMTQLEKETGNRLPLVALLENPSVKKLAAYMDSAFVTWDSLVPLKPKGTKVPLYIVHGAHHNVFIFNDLAKLLDVEQPVYALQPKGLDGVSEPFDTIEEMAAHYISEIQAAHPEGPYALAGFSMGGIVAYEMSRQLRAQGKQVKNLSMFDAYVFPMYYFRNPLMKKIVSLLYLIGKIFFMILNMFSSKKNFKRRIQLTYQSVSGVFLRLKVGREKQHEMQHNRSYKMDSMHNLATHRYTIEPQDIVLDIFRSSEEINFVHDSNFLGWKKIARKGIRKHMVPGNHIDMFAPPNVDAFAKQLQYVLDNYNSDRIE
ncbi:non-ribosomal peptide synthetase [Robiginitalea aurantiaca]|uniref:Amino acid adenylation domain-containing protein n=1 Tax=Robiginitalea aurantiaca TaxID=3056915 RepID=A0ABT7WBL3_9FLAO|nr:non-ribosomal peptide synthetase [Robiginitalea aurantiaca]MDM9630301.1 amino acid adenylation domain-containing protein [Robiginitalea aurantiaca]